MSAPSTKQLTAAAAAKTTGPGWLSGQPVVARLSLALLGMFTVALVFLLWPHWRSEPELSHAFLTPLLFVYLLHEARSAAPRYPGSRRAALAGTVVLLLLGLLVLAVSGLYATAVDWSHALVAFSLAVALACIWGAGLVALASAETRFVPLNWVAVVAVLLWVLSAPLPPGTYSRLTLGLQFLVTENVLRALHLLGIPAVRHGNVIELAATSVGVEDACSGIRSLLSCLYAGLLFSATLVRAAWARVVVVGLAGPIALGMNFVRSLALTLLANAGVNIAGRWHDLTGFGILGITAILLGGLALLLEKLDRNARTARSAPKPGGNSAVTPPGGDASVRSAPAASGARPANWLLAGLLVVALVAGFFVANTRPSVRRGARVPDLAAILPAAAAGWSVETTGDLYQFSATLRTDHLAQRTYLRTTGGGLEQITIYLAYWRAGQAPVSLVASHTPDACWPGNGWEAVATAQTREPVSVGGRSLPEPEYRVFRSGGFPQYVWFWHIYDGHPLAYRNPYSAGELLRSAWQHGFSHDGDQLFVRLSSNRPWAAFAREPLLKDVFARLRDFGL